MERKEYFRLALWAVIFLLIWHPAGGQKRYSDQIYRAYISGDIDGWERTIRELESSPYLSTAEKLELSEYYYAHIGYLLGVGRKKEAKTYIDRGEALTDDILAGSPDNATATSLKGTFIAYKMELNKLKAPVLGPQCMKYIKKAYGLDPTNVQAVSDLGNMYYHCPAVFGGDRKKGMNYLRQAVGLMESRGEVRGNWFYLNLLTMLAQYEAESGSKARAREIYEKVLAAEPDFVWVRDELYPRLLK